MENGLLEILSQLRSSDTNTIKGAENQIQYYAFNYFPETVSQLSDILVDENIKKENRQLAASLLKNWITLNESLQSKWLQMNPSIQEDVRNKVLATLASNDKTIRKAAGFTVAGICKVELPQNKWPNIIPSLIQNCQNENLNIKLASLETLGLILEELRPRILSTEVVDQILNAVLSSLQSNLNNSEVVNYCLKSFEKVMPHCEKNFADQVKS